MKCEQIKKLLVSYLDRELAPVKLRLVELHLAGCECCREEMEALKMVQAELRLALSQEAEETSPTPQLWEKLQQRLESKAPFSFWGKYGSWLNRPLWRAVVPIVLVVMVFGTLWGMGMFSGFGGTSSPPPAITPVPTITVPRTTTAPTTAMPVPAPVPGIVPGPDFDFDRTPDIISALGNKVEIKLSFINRASEPRLMSSFPPEIKIVALPNLQPPDVVVRSFPAGTRERLLQPEEKITYELTWDQHNSSGQQVAPGWYGAEVKVLYYRNPSAPVNGATTIQGMVTRVLVPPPQGVMEKTVQVNQSQTVNGITITMQHVDLTATGMKVYAFNTPPGYSLPTGQPGPAPSMWLHAEAEYSFDGGAIKQAFPSGINFKENGVLHSWTEYLDPAPKDAKELTFRIIRLFGPPGQDFEGPWEFKILLDQ